MNSPSTVTLDKENFITVDGERFFPFGFYIKETNDADVMRDHVKTLGEAGFNTVQIESFGNDRIEAVFDEADAQNVKIIYGPNKSFGADSSRLSSLIDDISQEASLLAYTIGDDVNEDRMFGRPKDVAEVKEFHDSIKEQDPNHLTFVAIGGGGTKSIYDERSWDVSGREIYPVNGGSFISATFDFTRQNVLASEENGQAAIAILQAWDYDLLQNPNNEPVDSNRLPTPEEFTNMTYQSIVAGVQGIIFYAYDYYDDDNIDGFASNPELFAAASELAQDVEILSPFLLSGTYELTTLAHQLHLATFEVGNEFVAVIVYSGDYRTFDDPTENADITKEVTFELPEGYEATDVNNLFGDETFAQTNDDGTVTVTIDRLDVQVSHFEKEEAVPTLDDDYLVGTVSADDLDGLSGDDRISGREGDDFLRGGAGADEIFGGEGDDDLFSGSGSDVVHAGAGNDYVRVGGGQETFYGGQGQDYISYYDSANGVKINLETNSVSGSWAENDLIDGFESASGSKTGDDVIYGTSGSNEIKTYGGNDLIYGGIDGNDTLFGGGGIDRIYGGAGKVQMYGGQDKDKLYAGDGDTSIYGGEGNDLIKVTGDGANLFVGGDGIDRISYYDADGGITIDLGADRVSRYWADDDEISGFENVSGSKVGNNKIYGTSEANDIDTYDGNDKVYGGGGGDKVSLGEGNDFVRAGFGQNTYEGSSGLDTLSYYDSSDGVIVDLKHNEAKGGYAKGDVISGFERLTGSTADDKLYGSDGGNILKGSTGQDSLWGRAGNDKLYGGSNSDRFDGGTGNDKLYGGSGADTFHFDKGDDFDTIKDFQNNADRIEIDGFKNDFDAFDFATQVGTDVVFDFGGGDGLIVEDALIGQLRNDLFIV